MVVVQSSERKSISIVKTLEGGGRKPKKPPLRFWCWVKVCFYFG